MSNDKLLNIDSHTSDSPLVKTIWRSQSRQAGEFLSIASSHWEMIVSNYEGRVYFGVRGPETRPTVAYCPPDGEWLGIQLKHGVFMPHLPVIDLVDGMIELPEASSRSFWLHGSAWEFPTFENAEAFIARLVKEELLVRDPIVESTLQAHASDPDFSVPGRAGNSASDKAEKSGKMNRSLRSVQRRFLRATGLTHGTVSQIERAHRAVALLQQGVSILDTVELAGYADQPHLTRSLKRLIGQTPTQLAPQSKAMPLSYSSVITPAE